MAGLIKNLRVTQTGSSSRTLQEAHRRSMDFFREACRALPAIMDRYNLQEVTTLADLRSKIAAEFRKHSKVSNLKVTWMPIGVSRNLRFDHHHHHQEEINTSICSLYGMLIDGYFFCWKCIAGCGHVGVQGARGAPVLCWPFEAATPSSRSVHHWKGRASWWCPQARRDGSWRVRVFEELLSRQQLRKNLYTMLQNFMILHSLTHSLTFLPQNLWFLAPCSLIFREEDLNYKDVQKFPCCSFNNFHFFFHFCAFPCCWWCTLQENVIHSSGTSVH